MSLTRKDLERVGTHDVYQKAGPLASQVSKIRDNERLQKWSLFSGFGISHLMKSRALRLLSDNQPSCRAASQPSTYLPQAPQIQGKGDWDLYQGP